MSLLLTDIDHFKKFNDTFGHLTGDQVLRLVAMSVKQNVKGQDIAARYGGEEFAIVLPNTVLRSAITVADHIRRAVMAKELMKRSTGEHLGRVTISVGVATLRTDDTAADADRARRRLPLCRQARRPQPGDLRDRSGSRQAGARPRWPERVGFAALRPLCSARFAAWLVTASPATAWLSSRGFPRGFGCSAAASAARAQTASSSGSS